MNADRVLVMWTFAASESRYVEAEYSHAIHMNKDVVPILLDSTPLPEALAAYQWIDFRPFIETAINRRLAQSVENLMVQAIGIAPASVSVALMPLVAAAYRKLLNRRIEVRFSDEDATHMNELYFERIAKGFGK